jgi:hypothetical protein
MHNDCYPERVKEFFEKKKKNYEEYKKGLPVFKNVYQRWYSESIALLKQVLPDRVGDFVRHYEKPKTRKDISFENYRIEDYLQGLVLTRGGLEKRIVVDTSAAIPHMEQQISIVEAAKSRFESSLFEIKQLVQADMFDSELEAAEALNRFKFARAAGALAGVVLERHLGQVCEDHSLKSGKKNPTISDFNDLLKNSGTIEVPDWRFIQHLADIRNLCDHSKSVDPTIEQVSDLIAGVKKIIKTIY